MQDCALGIVHRKDKDCLLQRLAGRDNCRIQGMLNLIFLGLQFSTTEHSN